jgi:hypothetical protein
MAKFNHNKTKPKNNADFTEPINIVLVIVIVVLLSLIFIKNNYKMLHNDGFENIKFEMIRNISTEKHFFITYNKMEKLFNHFNIKYVSSGGTLIGAVRDARFIPWDYDMDFCTDYKNKNILFSNEFKKKAENFKLDIEYYESKWEWGEIGGLKISDKGGWEKGQIDVFFFSNAVNEDVYYLGNDGKPHTWENHNYKKNNLFPLQFLDFRFPTIDKSVRVPCPNKYHQELARHFGKDYMKPPPDKKELYELDKIIYK